MVSRLLRYGKFPVILPLMFAIVVVALPWLGLNMAWQSEVIMIAILALLASGLSLSFGYAGELALAQTAMYAAGAYVTGYLAIHGFNDIVLNLVLAGFAALIIGLLTGAPGLRLGGWSLAMTSFFVVLIIPDVVNLLPAQTGGALGLPGIPNPSVFGWSLSTREFYIMAVLVVVLWLTFMRNLVTTRHGVALGVLRQSPVLATSLGMSVYRTKLTTYMIASVPAGFAGCLFAYAEHYISPSSFGFNQAITILAAAILGGTRSVYGAVAGAAIVQVGLIQTTAFGEYTLVVYGAFLLVAGVFFGAGLAGLARRVLRLLGVRLGDRSAMAVEPGDSALSIIHGQDLVVDGLSKSFGGNQALRGVSMTAAAGEVTAIIGPNGSGKTTVLNVICRFYHPDAGTIQIGEGRAKRNSPDLVARRGVSRTFQTPIVPPGVTVREGVAAGLYAREYIGIPSAVLRLPRFSRRRAADLAQVHDALKLVGLEDQADREAASLPLGTRRLFELARAVVNRPHLLLLDEVASGLDENELIRLAALIKELRSSGATVLLVEHNFRFVLDVSDRIYVMAQGQLIASGPATEIARNPRVMSEYLGLAEQTVAHGLQGMDGERSQ